MPQLDRDKKYDLGSGGREVMLDRDLNFIAEVPLDTDNTYRF